jgi:hypothetical protein
MSLANRIINDTLKGPDNKWSRKSLTAFISMVISVLTGAYIVVSDYFLDREINQYAIMVFYGFLGLGGGTLGLTVIDKIKNKTE